MNSNSSYPSFNHPDGQNAFDFYSADAAQQMQEEVHYEVNSPAMRHMVSDHAESAARSKQRAIHSTVEHAEHLAYGDYLQQLDRLDGGKRFQYWTRLNQQCQQAEMEVWSE